MQQIDPNMRLPIVAGLVMLALVASIAATWLWALVWFALGGKFLPRRERAIVPWGARSVLVCVVSYVLLQVVFAGAYTRTVYQGKPPLTEDQKSLALSAQDHLAISAGSNILVLVVIPLILFLGARTRLADIGFTWKDAPRNLVRGVLGYFLLAPIVFAAFGFALSIWGKNNHPMEDLIRSDQSGTTIALTVLTGVILAPVVEELLFRGLLLGWLLGVVRRQQAGASTAPDWSVEGDEIVLLGDSPDDPTAPHGDLDHDPNNPYAAPNANPGRPASATSRRAEIEPGSDGVAGVLCNVGVSLLFAALHGKQWPAPIPIFILSMGLGYLYQRTNSLVPSITLHMVFNGISTALMFLVVGSGLGNKMPGVKPAEKIVKAAAEAADAPKPIPGVKDAPPKPETKESSPK